jgi:hypothetical protein
VRLGSSLQNDRYWGSHAWASEDWLLLPNVKGQRHPTESGRRGLFVGHMKLPAPCGRQQGPRSNIPNCCIGPCLCSFYPLTDYEAKKVLGETKAQPERLEKMIGQMDILMDEGSDTDAPHPCHEPVKRTP